MSNSHCHSFLQLSAATLHIVEAGPEHGPTIMFLHGWPQDWSAWSSVMTLAAQQYRCIAVDLPGIGGSKLSHPNGSKSFLASLIHEAITVLKLHDVTLVGHDVGGMVTFAYLKQYSDLRRAVIMDTVIPGVPPWEQVIANPYIWHFAFHAVPRLPETLVKAHVRSYFDYFYDTISGRRSAITEEARNRYAASYHDDAALIQGFEFYRAFSTDASENVQNKSVVVTPTLYLRGSSETGNITDYENGLISAGIHFLTTRSIEGAGHFAPEESPKQVWESIAAYLAM